MSETVTNSSSGVERNHEFADRREAPGTLVYPDALASVETVMSGNVGRAANREGVDSDVAPGSVVDPKLEEELLRHRAGDTNDGLAVDYSADEAGNLSVVLAEGAMLTTVSFSAEEVADSPELQSVLAAGDRMLALGVLRVAANNRSSERNLTLSKPEYF